MGCTLPVDMLSNRIFLGKQASGKRPAQDHWMIAQRRSSSVKPCPATIGIWRTENIQASRYALQRCLRSSRRARLAATNCPRGACRHAIRCIRGSESLIRPRSHQASAAEPPPREDKSPYTPVSSCSALRSAEHERRSRRRLHAQVLLFEIPKLFTSRLPPESRTTLIAICAAQARAATSVSAGFHRSRNQCRGARPLKRGRDSAKTRADN